MRIEIRERATARDLAELHRRLSEARLALFAVICNWPDDCPLKAASADRLHRTAAGLTDALLSLETPMCRRAGGVLLSSPDRPDAWHEWLDEREAAPQ